jgi:potassium efflux system protein
VVITVGVAYGSDTRKAMTLMRGTSEEHPASLSDPAPRVPFEGFGDNSLTLVLRAYP